MPSVPSVMELVNMSYVAPSLPLLEVFTQIEMAAFGRDGWQFRVVQRRPGRTSRALSEKIPLLTAPRLPAASPPDR